jgi:hypothetical protein
MMLRASCAERQARKNKKMATDLLACPAVILQNRV